MEVEEVRSLQFEARDGRSKRPAEFAPDFERVAEVQYELENPRLHDKGVVACAGKGGNQGAQYIP